MTEEQIKEMNRRVKEEIERIAERHEREKKEFRKLWSDRINILTSLEPSLPPGEPIRKQLRECIAMLQAFAQVAEDYKYPRSDVTL